jgi:hypothetical protein
MVVVATEAHLQAYIHKLVFKIYTCAHVQASPEVLKPVGEKLARALIQGPFQVLQLVLALAFSPSALVVSCTHTRTHRTHIMKQCSPLSFSLARALSLTHTYK